MIRISALFMMVFIPGLASGLCVKTQKANLRQGPGRAFPVSWEVGENMPFKKIGRSGNWYEIVDLDGQVHWIHTTHVTFRRTCYVIKSKQAALRMKAHMRASLASIPFADRYTPLKKLDRDGRWVKVEGPGKLAVWIHDSNLWAPVSFVKIDF